MFNFLRNNTHRLNQQEAHLQLQNDASILILDVRTKEEFVEGHVAKSINIPLDKLDRIIEKKVLDKENKLFVICYSGSRSAVAVKILAQLGYNNAFDIGGIATWKYGITR
jgi:phage shock protein E